MRIHETLSALRGHGTITALDDQFARRAAEWVDENSADVVLAAALASNQVARGHVCLDVRSFAEDQIGDALAGSETTAPENSGGALPVDLPSPERWLDALRGSALVGAGSQDGAAATPLVLDDAGRLYLARYWRHQQQLAQALLQRASAEDFDVDDETLRDGLTRLFPATVPVAASALARPSRPESQSPGEQLGFDFASAVAPPTIEGVRESIDWQRVAAVTALLRPLCVVTGGPGTGKTSTVVKILALIAEQSLARGGPPPRALLAAPTGKAAARLLESIDGARVRLDCAPEIIAAIPTEAFTLHRCLGSVGGSSTRFRHAEDAPFAADVIVVDEASMVDLALLSRFVAAVPQGARLILLGDRNQLASVEAGAVLGELCGDEARDLPSAGFAARYRALTGESLPSDEAAEPESPRLRDSIVRLRVSHRFSDQSGIGALAEAIRAGDDAGAWDILTASDDPTLQWIDAGSRGATDALRELALGGYRPVFEAPDAATALERLSEFRVLCAHRRGPTGALVLGGEIERMLQREGRINPVERDYVGRPLMVTRNDPRLHLYNGDVGILWSAADGRGVQAFFRDSEGALRDVAPSRLPARETVFAMSIHKSQGSEFEHIVVVLPERMSRVLSRELVYTAVTRARASVTVVATEGVFREAVLRRVVRTSGLYDALWSRGARHGGDESNVG